jgi:hypothetical protein
MYLCTHQALKLRIHECKHFLPPSLSRDVLLRLVNLHFDDIACDHTTSYARCIIITASAFAVTLFTATRNSKPCTERLESSVGDECELPR